MSKPSNIQIKEIVTSTKRHLYRTPMKFGGRVVRDAVILNVKVSVEDRTGKVGVGLGSMPLGNIWGWPTTNIDADLTLQTMVDFADSIHKLYINQKAVGHPLEIGHAVDRELGSTAVDLCKSKTLDETMPRLAQLVVFSAFDAAIHDAYGRLVGQNSFQCLGKDFVNHDLSHYLNDDFKGEYLDQYTSNKPTAKMPLYHLVGALDPIFESDIETRLNDGLPETLGEWIVADGLTHLKIKLAGNDLDWDVNRVLSIEKAAIEAQSKRNCNEWFYSLDFNEKCESVDYILDFLKRTKSSTAFERVQYIEQPTHRDLKSHPGNVMFEAAKVKPVVIDESLVDFESLLISREQGYSGVALKACKGQGEALMMGAAAQKYDLFLCVQDLTCVGASFLHSASLAAHIPTVKAIEGNGRQYCPAGNEGWADRFQGMFNIADGCVKTETLDGIGLGIYSDDCYE